MNINNNNLEEKLERLLRHFLCCKTDYLNSFSGLFIKIKPYENSINLIIIFLINECNYEYIIDIAEFLNKIEAFYYGKYGTHTIWIERNTKRQLQKLIKSKQLIDLKISNNKILKI